MLTFLKVNLWKKHRYGIIGNFLLIPSYSEALNGGKGFCEATWTWSVLLCRDEVVAGGGQFVAAGCPDRLERPGQEQTSQPGRWDPPGEEEEGRTG